MFRAYHPLRPSRFAAIVLALFAAQTLWAQDEVLPPPNEIAARGNAPLRSDSMSSAAGFIPGNQGIGGPISVPAQLQSEQATGPRYRFPGVDKPLQPWFRLKNRLADDCFLQLGGDYNTLYQVASDSLTENKDAAGSIFRVFGDWTLFGEENVNSGSLIFKGENRTRQGTNIPPSELGFEVGYLGIPGTLFNDNGWFLSTLYWEQAIRGRAGLVIGRLEPDSFIDVAGYANPYISFQNLSILVNNTIPLPDVGFGAATGVVFQDQWTIKGGFYDANGSATTYDAFSEGGEFFTHLELSWAPTRAERYSKEIHVTAWHVDRRQRAGVPESYGIAISGNWTFRKRLMPFFRVGWSDGEAPLMNRAVSTGLLRYCARRGDLTGIGFSWEAPSDRNLQEQKSLEAFYKLQLSQNLAMTPSLQVLIDPSLNPTENTLALFGFRARLTF